MRPDIVLVLILASLSASALFSPLFAGLAEMFAGFSFKIALAFMYYEVIRRAFRLIDLATKLNKFIDVHHPHFSKKYGVAASS